MVFEVDYERIARESSVWRRSPTKEENEREIRLFGKIRHDPEPKFESFSKRLKYQNRHAPAALWNEICMSKDKERYREELRRQHQAKLARRLHRATAERLGVTNRVEENLPLSLWYLLRPATTSVTANTKQQLQVSRNNMQLRVSIHPYTVEGHRRKSETVTLQAHAIGFRFSNYSIPFQMDVMYINIKHAFFQDGDEKMAPFLHLHLHNPVMLGTETTKDIQFHMVQTFFEGRKRKGPLALNSDKLDKEQQKAVDNQLMQKFVGKVHSLWRRSTSVEFKKIKRSRGFHAKLPMKKHTSFLVMTLYCLVHLNETPFHVITLEEVEVVNLVRTQSESEVFSMTFVFKDFSLDVFHINSIPSEHLLHIKEWLDSGWVKYYENEQDISNWRNKLNSIMDDPKKFIDLGGWNFLNSGEDATQYSDSSVGSLGKSSGMTLEESDYESDSRTNNKEKCTTQAKLTKPVIRRVNVVMSDESDS
ncbi:hypothetical protein MKX03_037171 [Papaver bracteatum]|nr:hypothetical protein MKX03_037171 [Papaver bracteatum]